MKVLKKAVILPALILSSVISSHASANCKSAEIVDNTLTVAQVVGAFNGTVKTATSLVTPFAGVFTDQTCKQDLSVSPEEARKIAEQVVLANERENLNAALESAAVIMTTYAEVCVDGQEASCRQFVINNALGDVGTLSSGEDKAYLNGFLLAPTLQTLVANRYSLLTLWAKAKIEYNELLDSSHPDYLTEEVLKSTIKSTLTGRTELSYNRMQQVLSNYVNNINWVLEDTIPLLYRPSYTDNLEVNKHRYCFYYMNESGCSKLREKRKKARNQAKDRRYNQYHSDIRVRSEYIPYSYILLMQELGTVFTDSFDSWYAKIR